MNLPLDLAARAVALNPVTLGLEAAGAKRVGQHYMSARAAIMFKMAHGTYQDQRPERLSYDGAVPYTFDRELSSWRASVYSGGEDVIIAFRGTKAREDLLSDAEMVLGDQLSSTMPWAFNLLKIVVTKYRNRRVAFTGHSLGGSIAEALYDFCNRHSITWGGAALELGDCHVFNKGVGKHAACRLPARASATFTHHHMVLDPVSAGDCQCSDPHKDIVSYLGSADGSFADLCSVHSCAKFYAFIHESKYECSGSVPIAELQNASGIARTGSRL